MEAGGPPLSFCAARHAALPTHMSGHVTGWFIPDELLTENLGFALVVSSVCACDCMRVRPALHLPPSCAQAHYLQDVASCQAFHRVCVHRVCWLEVLLEVSLEVLLDGVVGWRQSL